MINNYRVQVIFSGIFKSLSILFNVVALPISVSILGTETFGLWVMMSSIIGWFLVFDFGIGNGLRSRLIELQNQNQKDQSKQLIVSSLAFFGLIAVILFLFLSLLNISISHQSILNNYSVENEILSLYFQVFIFFTILNFWSSIVHFIYLAEHKAHIVQFINFMSSLLILCSVSAVHYFGIDDFLWYIVIYLFAASLGNLIFFARYVIIHDLYLYFGRINFRSVFPEISFGINIFVLQMAGIIIFSTDKYIIGYFLGAEKLAHVEILQRLFSIFLIFHSIVMGPIWSLVAYNAASKKPHVIRKIFQNQVVYWLLLSIACIAFSGFSLKLASIWVGFDIELERSAVYLICSYCILYTLSSLFSTFLNGLKIVKVQIKVALVGATLNIPLSILLCDTFGLGVSGVFVASLFSLTLSCLFSGFSLVKIICMKNVRAL